MDNVIQLFYLHINATLKLYYTGCSTKRKCYKRNDTKFGVTRGSSNI